MRLIGERGKDYGVTTATAHKFGCTWRTANRYVRHAKELIRADMPTVVEASRLQVRRLLTEMLYDPAEDNAGRRATLKMMIDLLGLAAPQRIETADVTRPVDPIAAYAADPGLRDRALQLERDLANAGNALGTEHAGPARFAGVPIPAAHPSAGSGGNGDANGNGKKPPDN